MESFKIGFGPETAADNELCGGAAVGDDLFVDELLDFSNGYSETEEQMEEPQEVETEAAKTTSVFRETPPPENSSGNEDFGSLHESELSFQAEEGLESLEWLSHFVEDSFSDYSLTGKLPAAAPVEEQPCFASPVRTKARTKRNRTGVRVWPVLSDSSTSSSSSSSSTTSFPPSSFAISSNDSILPAKRQKRKQSDGGAASQPRRCSHCGVTKTPQWRAGPHGPKTLCNACGVRFKSGRLLPEYRPACSPTFSTELHSNNHRKVLEMRQKKEPAMEATGLPMPVQGLID